MNTGTSTTCFNDALDYSGTVTTGGMTQAGPTLRMEHLQRVSAVEVPSSDIVRLHHHLNARPAHGATIVQTLDRLTSQTPVPQDTIARDPL